MTEEPELSRLVPDWHIRITNFGLAYILLTLLVAIAATNTGNNGLYAALAGLLSTIVVSGILSRRMIRAVESEAEPLGEAFAGQPTVLRVRLRNRSPRVVAQGVWFLHEAVPAPLLVEPLRPGERREVFVDAVFPRRGAYRRFDAGTMTRFPIGLFRKYADLRSPREVLVYPRVEPSRFSIPLEESLPGRTSSGRRKGSGAEVRTFREFVFGDDIRDLHWKQSARMQKWIVREREEERSRVVIFAVDNAVDNPLSPADASRVERTIERVAGEALALLARGGEAGLAARGVSISPRGGAIQRRILLDALARLPVVPAAGAPPIPPPRPGEVRRIVAA